MFYQPDALNPQGYLLPFHLDTRATSAQKIPSTSHAWAVQHAGVEWRTEWINGCRPIAKPMACMAPTVMGYYNRTIFPSISPWPRPLLSAMPTTAPSWDRRTQTACIWMTGMIDPDGLHGGPLINNIEPKDGFSWTTYPERLEQAGISWKVYQQQDNFGCNMLEYFRTFQEAPKSSSLYAKGMVRGPEGQFEYDAIHDKLPAVSWIIPTSFQSEHPDYMPADGAAFIASKIDAIAANPDVWAKTVFILNYDENDGIFDHVAPPVPPPGTPDEFVQGLPIGAGFRVPCILISPWTTGGWVCSQQFDHTSVLQFLERFTGVREPNISPWRRSTFGDLTSGFRFRHAQNKISRTARYHHPVKPRQVRVSEFAQSRLSHCRPAASETGKRLPQAHLATVYIQVSRVAVEPAVPASNNLVRASNDVKLPPYGSPCRLPGVLRLRPRLFSDDRGRFAET